MSIEIAKKMAKTSFWRFNVLGTGGSSSSFARLAHKTQVFVESQADESRKNETVEKSAGCVPPRSAARYPATPATAVGMQGPGASMGLERHGAADVAGAMEQDLDLRRADGGGATDEMDRDGAGDGGSGRTYPERWAAKSKKQKKNWKRRS